MQEPLVSVVIATYNMGQYLADAARSVLNQTWKNLELIIIDDGSTDNTSQVVEPLLADGRVKYLPQKNAGQPKAKNAGIRACRGDYIAFCDGDDLWVPRKLELQMACMQENPKVGVVYSRVDYMDQHGHFTRHDQPHGHSGKITDQLIVYNFIPFGTSMVRKRVLDQCGIFDESLPMGIDWDLWLRISTVWEFRFLPEVTYLYREWPGQMSKNFRGRYINAFRIMNKFFDTYPDAVSPAVKRRAWSDTYAGRGMAIARGESKRLEPLFDCLRAIALDPVYSKAWRSLIKVLIGRV